MTVERTSFQISVEGEGQAVAEARTVGREMDAIARKAREAEVAAGRATTVGGRLNDLFNRARANGNIKRGGIEAGIFELNASGFGLDRRALRGIGGGATGAAFIGVALAHGVGAGLNQIADLKDYINRLLEQKLSAREIANNLAIKASESLFDRSGAASILKGLLRLGGEKASVVEEAFRLTFASKEELIAEDKAEKRAAKLRREAIDAIQDAQKKALIDLESKKLEAWQKSDEAVAREIAGIKNETLPVGLPRRLAAIYRARRVSEAQGRGIRRSEAAERAINKAKEGQGD